MILEAVIEEELDLIVPYKTDDSTNSPEALRVMAKRLAQAIKEKGYPGLHAHTARLAQENKDLRLEIEQYKKNLSEEKEKFLRVAEANQYDALKIVEGFEEEQRLSSKIAELENKLSTLNDLFRAVCDWREAMTTEDIPLVDFINTMRERLNNYIELIIRLGKENKTFVINSECLSKAWHLSRDLFNLLEDMRPAGGFQKSTKGGVL